MNCENGALERNLSLTDARNYTNKKLSMQNAVISYWLHIRPSKISQKICQPFLS